jgi:tetratricopeptide (TPR) repeat protein
MVFLKYKTFGAILGFAILTNSVVIAQDDAKIFEAFKNSYAMEKSGDYKKAGDLIKAVYKADFYEMNVRLGWVQYNAGLFDESAAYYQSALKLKPYSEEAKFGLIYPKAAQGKWEEVINIYNKILEVNPKSTTANYRLGLIYYGQNNYEKALSYFEKVLDLYPFDYDSLLMAAWSDYFLGKKREAEVLFKKVLLYNPGDASATDGLGLLK